MVVNGISAGTSGVGSGGLVETSTGPDGVPIIQAPITIPPSAVDGGAASLSFAELVMGTWLRHDSVLSIPINANASSGNVILNVGMFDYLSKPAKLWLALHNRILGAVEFRFTIVGASTITGIYTVGTTPYYLESPTINDLRVIEPDRSYSANNTNIYTFKIGPIIGPSGIPYAWWNVNPPGAFRTITPDVFSRDDDLPHIVLIQNIPLQSAIQGDITSVQYTIETRLDPSFRTVLDNVQRLDYIYDTLMSTENSQALKAQGDFNFVSLSKLFNRKKLFISKDGQFSYKAGLDNTSPDHTSKLVRLYQSSIRLADYPNSKTVQPIAISNQVTLYSNAFGNGIAAYIPGAIEIDDRQILLSIFDTGPILFSIWVLAPIPSGSQPYCHHFYIYANQFGSRVEHVRALCTDKFQSLYFQGDALTFIEHFAGALIIKLMDSDYPALTVTDLYTILLSISNSYSDPVDNSTTLGMRIFDGVVSSQQFDPLVSVTSLEYLERPAPEYTEVEAANLAFDRPIPTLIPIGLQLTANTDDGEEITTLFLYASDSNLPTANPATDSAKFVQHGPNYAYTYYCPSIPSFGGYTYTITRMGTINDTGMVKVPEEYVRIIFTEDIPQNVAPTFSVDGFPTISSLIPELPEIGDDNIFVFDLYTPQNKQTIMKIAYSPLYQTFYSTFNNKEDYYSVYNSQEAAELLIRNARVVSMGNVPDRSPYDNFLSRVVNTSDPNATYIVPGNGLSPKLSKVKLSLLKKRNG